MRVTTDGGKTWRPLTPPSEHVDGLRFANPKDGWAWGPNLYSTHDGGNTWAKASPGQTVPEIHTKDVQDSTIWQIDRNCPPVGKCTLTLRISKDKGGTWQVPTAQPAIQGSDFQLVQPSAREVWVFSWDYYRDGDGNEHYQHYLVETQDGGRSWQTLTVPCSEYMKSSAIGFPGGALWLLCTAQYDQGFQAKEIYKSTDGGKHWDLRASTDLPETSTSIHRREGISGFGALSPTTIWITYTRYLGMQITFNDGRKWENKGMDAGGGGIGPVFFLDAKHGWVGSRGDIFRTTDGGHTWEGAGLNSAPQP